MSLVIQSHFKTVGTHNRCLFPLKLGCLMKYNDLCSQLRSILKTLPYKGEENNVYIRKN